MPLEDFFIAYGKQDRAPGEFVAAVRVPKLGAGEHFRCYKISKRFDQDISAVMGAFSLRSTAPRIADARIAFGGMAATPKRARSDRGGARSAPICGMPPRWQAAIDALAEDFAPIDDARAQRGISRCDVAGALLRKALTEIAGASTAATRVVTGFREAADVTMLTAIAAPSRSRCASCARATRA